jgi:hypothetical protein
LQAVLTPEGLPLVKKKGKVGYDDFYKLQSDLNLRLKESDVKLEQTGSVALEGK